MKHYVGIDLHARTLQLCVIDAEKGERILERARVANRLPEILELLEPFKEGELSIAVESTFNWYWLVDGLQDAGYEVHLAHTLGNARITKAKVKTDRRDAYRLARLLRSGDLQEGYIYPRETRPIRDLIRHRQRIVAARSGEYARIRIQLYREGILEHSRTSVQAMTDDEIETLFVHPAVAAVAHFELERICLLQAQITKIERQIEGYAGDLPEIILLRGLPGVDLALGPSSFSKPATSLVLRLIAPIARTAGSFPVVRTRRTLRNPVDPERRATPSSNPHSPKPRHMPCAPTKGCDAMPTASSPAVRVVVAKPSSATTSATSWPSRSG